MVTARQDIFGEGKTLLDGSESKVKVVPDVIELQTNPKYRTPWIVYSSRDAYSTWYAALPCPCVCVHIYIHIYLYIYILIHMSAVINAGLCSGTCTTS